MIPTNTKEKIAAYTKELRLPAIRNNYSAHARQALKDKTGYEEYLLKPNTKLLGDFNAVLPLKNGNICIEQKGNALSVFSTETEGVLEINDTRETVPANLRVTVYL
jgi:hypothetical protein